jgi:hypothetical protein
MSGTCRGKIRTGHIGLSGIEVRYRQYLYRVKAAGILAYDTQSTFL